MAAVHLENHIGNLARLRTHIFGLSAESAFSKS
jgi:hypothetical protein